MASTSVLQRGRSERYWPPDDTEESVVGTDLHQKTITNLRLGINECAELARQAEGPAPWQALSQIVLLGGRSRDRDDYRTMPDVFVYKRPIDLNRGSLTLSVDGPPALIIEVLSESTYATDIDLERGKGYTYAQAGVPEYLTIDPVGAFLSESIRAWRLVGGIYQPWLSAANGRWQSEEIGISVGLEGIMATIHAADGRRQLREGEIARELVRKDAELSRRDAELSRKDRALSRKDAELSRKDLELAELRRLVEELQGS
jgi:Uma2 family endonuclease